MDSFKEILAASAKTTAFGPHSTWTLMDMLRALRSSVLGEDHFIDDEFIEELKVTWADRLTLHTLYDVPHDSDESCSAHVLCADGKPALLFKRIGDKMDYSDGLSILDVDMARTLLRAMAEYRTEKALSEMAPAEKSPLELLWDCSYLTRQADTVFSVDSPKWALGFSHLVDELPCWLLADDGQVKRVTKFVRWHNRKPSWEGGDAAMATVQTSQGELDVDAHQLMFSLLPDSRDVFAAAAQLQQDSCWKIVEHIPFGDESMLCIVQHIKGRLVTESTNIKLPVSKAIRLMELYQGVQQGVFDKSIAA